VWWEKQLSSMLEDSHLDADAKADWAIGYAAETGDESLLASVQDPISLIHSGFFSAVVIVAGDDIECSFSQSMPSSDTFDVLLHRCSSTSLSAFASSLFSRCLTLSISCHRTSAEHNDNPYGSSGIRPW
jgi:hypothetical protein